MWEAIVEKEPAPQSPVLLIVNDRIGIEPAEATQRARISWTTQNDFGGECHDVQDEKCDDGGRKGNAHSSCTVRLLARCLHAVAAPSRHEQKRAPGSGRDPSGNWTRHKPGKEGGDQHEESRKALGVIPQAQALQKNEECGCDSGKKKNVIKLHLRLGSQISIGALRSARLGPP